MCLALGTENALLNATRNGMPGVDNHKTRVNGRRYMTEGRDKQENHSIRDSIRIILSAQALLAFVPGHLRGTGVRYVEGYCPASKPALQGAFLAAGFRPFGYVPAWNRDPRTGLHVDHVVFGWSACKVDPAATKFTGKSAALVGVLGL